MNIDLDLLADYADGLLGPADEARVAALVQDDREWAFALDALRSALPQVNAALAGANSEPIPPATLAAVLRAVQEQDSAAQLPELRPGDAPDGRREDTTAPRDTTRPSAGRPPSKSKAKRKRRLSAAVLTACALFALFGIGVGYLLNSTGQSTEKQATSAKAAAPQAIAGGAAGIPPVKIIISGLNYTAATLGSTAFASHTTTNPGPNAAAPNGTRAPLTSTLDRLSRPAALDECLKQVETLIGGHATTVDYAEFDGQPALIITLPDAGTVVAVGANCGVAGSGIDELARS